MPTKPHRVMEVRSSWTRENQWPISIGRRSVLLFRELIYSSCYWTFQSPVRIKRLTNLPWSPVWSAIHQIEFFYQNRLPIILSVSWFSPGNCWRLTFAASVGLLDHGDQPQLDSDSMISQASPIFSEANMYGSFVDKLGERRETRSAREEYVLFHFCLRSCA